VCSKQGVVVAPLGALDEAVLYVSRAEDPVKAKEDMYAVCDRIIAGIAG